MDEHVRQRCAIGVARWIWRQGYRVTVEGERDLDGDGTTHIRVLGPGGSTPDICPEPLPMVMIVEPANDFWWRWVRE